MTDGWKEVKLGDVARIIGGGTPSTKKAENFGGDIPWITPKDLSRHSGRYIAQGVRNITTQGLKSSGATWLPQKTVLLSSRAPIGYVVLAANPVTTNQGFKSLDLKEGHDPLFFYYLLKSMKDKLEQHSSGSTFKELSGKAVAGIKVKIPPTYGEQRQIADLLGSLDDRIEHNRKLAHLLEENARALYESWFVRFDPVQAKIAGERPRMKAETAALFPDRMDKNTSLPDGWVHKHAGDVFHYVGGTTPSTKNESFWGEDHAFATPKDMSLLPGSVLSKTARYLTDVGVKKIGSGLLPLGSVLMSSRAPIGYMAITTAPVAINQGFIAFPNSGKSVLPMEFIYFWLKSNMDVIKSRSGGSTFAEISKSNFRTIPVVVPTDQVFDAYRAIVRPMVDLMINLHSQNESLSDFRDLLLPRLISGHLRLPNAASGLDAMMRGEEQSEGSE